MIEEKYILLIHKQFRNELSEAEQLVLQGWIDQDPYHLTIVGEMEKTWQLSQEYQTQYSPDVEQGLQALKKRIHSDQVVKMDSHSSFRIKSLYSKFSIAASILIIIGALAVWNFWFRTENLNLVLTGPGEQKSIELADGSTVLLNENSELKYPSVFNHKRQVFLSGEAYFDIVRDENRTFQVLTAKTRTDVLGTGFNIRSYKSETFTEVEVINGTVRFTPLEAQKNEFLKLEEGHRGTFEHAAGLTRIQPQSLNATYWKVGYFRFKGQSLSDAITEIENRLKLEIDLLNPALASCALSTRIPIENPDSLVAAIVGPYNAQWKRIGDGHYVIEAGSCNN